MGKCFAAGRRGRYQEKGGGKQVGSFFEYSTDNEKIKAAYGNYNFWSWLRYWWIDSDNQVQLMLIDKGYYDYDYEEPKFKRILTEADKEIWSQDKLNAILGVKVKAKPMSADELQKIVMEDIENKKHKK